MSIKVKLDIEELPENAVIILGKATAKVGYSQQGGTSYETILNIRRMSVKEVKERIAGRDCEITIDAIDFI